jgi:integrase
MLRSLENNVFPWVGNKPISEIKPTELLTALRNAENRGALDLAHRLREMAGQVFRYAVATGRAERDPSGDLRGALPPVRAKHYASVTDPEEIAALLRATNGYSGSFVTLCALKLAPLIFVRPGELRHAEWSEINLDTAEWLIPSHKMKMQDKHIVPLSTQAIEILQAIHPLTGSGRYVFPSVRTVTRPMSENTVNAALRRLGYEKSEMTGHGFRSMASTILHEQGWPHEAIERQLAHAERNAVSAAYNYAEHLPKRREMMQAWADYLEALKSGAKVTLINRKLA